MLECGCALGDQCVHRIGPSFPARRPFHAVVGMKGSAKGAAKPVTSLCGWHKGVEFRWRARLAAAAGCTAGILLNYVVRTAVGQTAEF